MENLRSEVMKALENRLGEGYQITPKDSKKNNGIILHGICIYKEGDSVSPVVYPDEFTGAYARGELNPAEIADILLERCRREDISGNVLADFKNFDAVKDMVRIKTVNYDANSKELEDMPHRRFLDLAVIYYLDLDIGAAGQNASTVIRNELMEIWGAGEDDLYRLGMKALYKKDACLAIGITSLIRKLMHKDSKLSEMAAAELEEGQEDGLDMYVASNPKGHFGASCMLNDSFLGEIADNKGCSLIIYPSSVHEIIILPQKNGNEDCMSTENVQDINLSVVPGAERLSNSIYRYDRTRREVSIYKEGAPLNI